MDVEHALARTAIRVEQGPIAVIGKSTFLREDRGPADQFADNLFILHTDVVQRWYVPLWHDQHVRGCLRIDVVEREHAIVFVDDRGRNFPFDDFAEEAVAHER